MRTIISIFSAVLIMFIVGLLKASEVVAGADKGGGVNGGAFLFMMKPSISLSRPGGQIMKSVGEPDAGNPHVRPGRLC
jgi:hypothetical protein